MSNGDPIREGQILTGPPLSEPTRVEPVTPTGLSRRFPESGLVESSRIGRSVQSTGWRAVLDRLWTAPRRS